MIELIMVCAVIAMMAAISFPAFMIMRRNAKAEAFISELNMIRDAVQEFVVFNRAFPKNKHPKKVPNELMPFLPSRFDWEEETPLGGHWNWDSQMKALYGYSSHDVGIAISQKNGNTPLEAESFYQIVDERIDDGNLSTGKFKRGTGLSHRYVYIVQENPNHPWGAMP